MSERGPRPQSQAVAGLFSVFHFCFYRRHRGRIYAGMVFSDRTLHRENSHLNPVNAGINPGFEACRGVPIAKWLNEHLPSASEVLRTLTQELPMDKDGLLYLYGAP